MRRNSTTTTRKEGTKERMKLVVFECVQFIRRVTKSGSKRILICEISRFFFFFCRAAGRGRRERRENRKKSVPDFFFRAKRSPLV